MTFSNFQSSMNMAKALAVVVAQLVERSLPTPEIRGSIPISDINIDQYSTNCNSEKTKIKKKRPGKAHLLKTWRRLLVDVIRLSKKGGP